MLKIFFEKKLDLEESCKNSTDKPYVTITQFPLLLALYISIETSTKTKNIILAHYYLLKLFIWISSTFYVMFFSVSESDMAPMLHLIVMSLCPQSVLLSHSSRLPWSWHIRWILVNYFIHVLQILFV